MNDPRELLEEYLDGLLDTEEHKRVEAALATDADLRAELERVRGFERLLAGLHDEQASEQAIRHILARVKRRGRIVRLGVAASIAAALLVAFWVGAQQRPAGSSHAEEVILSWVEFGHRLGKIAAERRTGRVPRTGIGDRKVPPAEGYGVVFRGALEALGVDLNPALRKQAQNMVRDHFVALRGVRDDAAGESQRAEASLELYRKLRSLASRAVADAYYDVFRPGLATPRNVVRVRPGALEYVVNADRYRTEYEQALHQLRRRYGERALSIALTRLSGEDRRFLYRDAAQDGLGRDAVLSIRARLYRAARDAGADKLYIP